MPSGMNPCARPASHFNVAATVQKETDTIGIAGAQKGWTVYARCFVNLQSINGRDQWRAGQFTSQGMWMVEMRWIPGVVANMRVLCDDGRVMRIEAPPVNVGEKRRLLQMRCIELGDS